MEKYCTTGLTTNNNIIQPIRLAFWITKTTNIHSEYVIGLFIALPLQQWLHERASLLRYTYIACLVSAVMTDTQCSEHKYIMKYEKKVS